MKRRQFVGGMGAAALLGAVRAEPGRQLDALEARIGGRIGATAVDTGGGRRLSHRGDECFAMCSTFKWLLAAAVLAEIDANRLQRERLVPLTAADLLPHSPVTREHAGDGSMSVQALCAAAVEQSDNGAANLLLGMIGGPPSLTRYLRTIGDDVTRLDRTEPTLNTNLPGDVRDTTTPNAMVATMQRILTGDALSVESRSLLVGWLKRCKTGRDRLRAGLPADWLAGDKTGTGDNGAVNDVAIAWPPARPPVLIAVYLSGSTAAIQELSAIHARIGRIVARTL